MTSVGCSFFYRRRQICFGHEKQSYTENEILSGCRRGNRLKQLIAAIFGQSTLPRRKDWICAHCFSHVARMGERYNIHSQLEHLQSKYIGTGHADTTKFEWMVNQHRDSCSSYMGHHDLLNIFAIAENESKARVRFNIMEKMLQPCGPPPEKPED